MELLARDYHPVSLGDVVGSLNKDVDLPSRSVVVTFDDGYTDNSEVAMPLLNQLGIPATFYVTVDCVQHRKLPWPSRLRYAFRKTKVAAWNEGRGTSWELTDFESRERAYLASCDQCCQLSGKVQEDFVRTTEEQLRVSLPSGLSSLMMSYDQIRALVQHGHIVGSHTMTHPNMAHITKDEAQIELAESKQCLEAELKAAVTHFSYPCPALTPHWSQQTLEQSRAVGYESAVTTDGGVTRRGDDPLSLKRIRPTKTLAGLRWNLECAFAGRAV